MAKGRGILEGDKGNSWFGACSRKNYETKSYYLIKKKL